MGFDVSQLSLSRRGQPRKFHSAVTRQMLAPPEWGNNPANQAQSAEARHIKTIGG